MSLFLGRGWGAGVARRDAIFRKSVALGISLLEQLCFTVFTAPS